MEKVQINKYLYGSEELLALKLNGCFWKIGITGRKYITLKMGDKNPLAQYWIELLPGFIWEARTNEHGNKELLPMMEEAMRTAVKSIKKPK
jgi:hypothetical protein